MANVSGFDRCITAFGVVAGAGDASNGSDVDLEFDIPPVGYETQRGFEDYDPPSIEVDDSANDQQWAAGGDFTWLSDPPEPGESQIDSYVSKGGVVSGTATFIELNAYSDFVFGLGGQTKRPESVTGTFEVNCGA